MQYAGKVDAVEEAPVGGPWVRKDGQWVAGVEAAPAGGPWVIEDGVWVLGVVKPPDTGGPYVWMGGSWLEHVFGCEYQLTPQVNTPLPLGPLFQTYVELTTTVLHGGLYRVLPFVAVSGTSSNTEVEVKLSIYVAGGGPLVFETVTVDQTFTGAGDTLSFSGDVPFPLTPGSYDIRTECRQPASPGAATAVSGGTQLFRVL